MQAWYRPAVPRPGGPTQRTTRLCTLPRRRRLAQHQPDGGARPAGPAVRRGGARRAGRRLQERLPGVSCLAASSHITRYELWPPPLLEDSKLAKVREKAERQGKAVPPGNWMQRLRRECRWYVQEAGELEIYRQWRGMLDFPPRRLDLFLCRNCGWLRPCANLFESDVPCLRPPAALAVAAAQPKPACFSITRFRIASSAAAPSPGAGCFRHCVSLTALLSHLCTRYQGR